MAPEPSFKTKTIRHPIVGPGHRPREGRGRLAGLFRGSTVGIVVKGLSSQCNATCRLEGMYDVKY